MVRVFGIRRPPQKTMVTSHDSDSTATTHARSHRRIKHAQPSSDTCREHRAPNELYDRGAFGTRRYVAGQILIGKARGRPTAIRTPRSKADNNAQHRGWLVSYAGLAPSGTLPVRRDSQQILLRSLSAAAEGEKHASETL